MFNLIPDLTLVSSIIAAYLLDRYAPVIHIIPFPINLFGWVVAAAGFGLAVHIITSLRSKRTSTDPNGVPSTFITNGAYAFSRNPFYVCYVVTAFGAACILGSLTAFVAPIMCFAIIHIVVIPREEYTLQKKFGEKYRHYKQLVRRWI